MNIYVYCLGFLGSLADANALFFYEWIVVGDFKLVD